MENKGNRSSNTKYFRIAEITLAISADLPITETTFDPKYKIFEVAEPNDDCIRIRHHFSLPKEILENPGTPVGQKGPWTIHKKGNEWIYLSSAHDSEDKNIYQLAVFDKNYSSGQIYHPNSLPFKKGMMSVLTVYPTDQIVIAPILASRNACYFHSCGMILDGKGLLFIGHSEAGKSTMVKIMRNKAEILCDDRIIVRKTPAGFRMYGTWSHGEMPDISPNSVELKGIFRLIKDTENKIVPVEDKKEVLKNLLDCLVKPHASDFWWDNMLTLNARLAEEIPFSMLHFDKSGKIACVLESFQG